MAYIFYYRYLQMTIIKKKRNLGGGRSRGVRFTSFSGPLMRILQRVSFTSLTDPARRGKNQSWRTATARRRKCSAEADHLQKASEKKERIFISSLCNNKKLSFLTPRKFENFYICRTSNYQNSYHQNITKINNENKNYFVTPRGLHVPGISVLWIQIH